MRVTSVEGKSPAARTEGGSRVEGGGFLGTKAVAHITAGWREAGTFARGSSTVRSVAHVAHRVRQEKHG